MNLVSGNASFGIIVTTSTFPRWRDDVTPRFVLDLCRGIQMSGRLYCVALAPHAPGSSMGEALEGVRVERYRYAVVERRERLSQGSMIQEIRRRKSLFVQIIPFLTCQLIALRRLLIREGAPVVVANWLIPQALVASLLKCVFRKFKLLVVVHGGDIGLLRSRAGFRVLLRFIVRRCDAVVTVCNRLADELLSVAPAASVKTMCIPLGIDAREIIRSARPEVSSSIGRQARVLFCGRLVEKKGIMWLLRTHATLKRMGMEALLKVIGSGSLLNQAKRFCDDNGLSESVQFLGACTPRTVISEMYSANAFVAPHIDMPSDLDAIPRTVLEAAACGLPIISTDAGGIGEFIEHMKNGIMVKQGDVTGLAHAIAKIISDRDLARRLGDAARAAAIEHFSIETTGPRWEQAVLALAR